MDHFDVVVVGAGSAGATLAARLSEDPAVSVLLLEAGPDHPAATAPDGIRSANFFNAVMEPGRIWPDLVATRTANQPESIYIRGRGAGGSSSVNAMGAMRGTRDDYERWASEFACTGWGWPEMLESFVRAEAVIPRWRCPLDALPPFDLALRAAMKDLGYPTNDDYDAPDATGVSRWALTLQNNRRMSTNDAYLEPARTRANLAVRGDAPVDRVLVDGKRAVGVRLAGGEEVAADEVVVSAGAIHSPAILLRSGIGVDDGLPVGANLKDHASTPGFEVALNESGRMASADAPVMSSILRYASEPSDAGPNDMQIFSFNATGPHAEGLAGARLIGSVMRVFSHGEVRLRTDDPLAQPIVEFRMLSDERDLVRLRDSVHRILDIIRHPAVASVSEGVIALDTPVEALDSDTAIDEWLHANVVDYVHAAGTCAMGRVVDTDCRVIGYEGLRVCDASVMPDLPKANTHMTTVAIAERLATRIAGR